LPIGFRTSKLIDILLKYLFYMLYFDTLNRHHFGTLREQIWSFLHFPFHVALVLCLAGMAQFVIWQKITEGFKLVLLRLYCQFTTLLNEN
jgi:hypothetical protein